MNKRSMWLAGSSILTITMMMSFMPVGNALAACLMSSSTTDCSTEPSDLRIDEGTRELKNESLSLDNADVIVGTTTGKNAKFIISEGSVVTANAGYIGDVAGSTGEMIVTGDGSLWEYNGTWNDDGIHGRLLVGNNGTGSLTIEKGGKVVSGAFSAVGQKVGSIGTVTVTGAGSELITPYLMSIGASGQGNLTVADGGKLIGDDFYIGDEATGTGVLAVKGNDSAVEASGDLVVGYLGTGTLAVSDGAQVSSDRVLIGQSAGSNGTVTVTGKDSTITANTVAAGVTGKGELTVSNGGKLLSTIFEVGVNKDSIGTVTVTGKDSSITAFDMNVGTKGNGELVVSDGAQLNSSQLKIGNSKGSTGKVVVTGHESKLRADYVYVGKDGQGTLTISDGGTLTGKTLNVGTNIGSNGVVEVTGKDSSINLSSYLRVGYYGQGKLSLSDGATITSARGEIGVWDEGTVTVSGAGTRWNITELPYNTLPLLYVGMTDKGELTISNGAEVSAGITALGNVGRFGAKGTINIGAAAGAPAVAAGKLTTRVIEFGSGDGTLNFNHTDSAYEFSGDLISKTTRNEAFALTSVASSGTHEIHQIAGTTLLTGNGSAFTGTTYVDGGKLLVGNSAGIGTLGGNISVGSGGILGGSGTIGTVDTHSSVTVASGGILAPGNSIGTLTINGDLNLKSGSVLAVEVGGAGTGDRVVVTGNAALAGTVQVTALNNGLSYKDGVAYRFLYAATTSGSFDDVVSDSAFIKLGLTEDGVGALVQVGSKSGEALFATAAKTENHFAASTALDTLTQSGASLALYNKILILNAENGRAAFDQLSGEAHASAKSALIENAQLTQNAINNRLRSAFGDAPQSADVAALGFGPETSGKKASVFDTVAAKDKAQAGYGAWTQGFGRWSKQDGNGNVGDFKSSTGGFVAGADSVIAENWRLGVLAGYSHTSFHANERSSSGNSENYTLGTYAGSQWAVSGGTLSFNTGLAYTWHQLETKRTIAFNNFADSLSADYKAATVQAFGELGYKVTAGNAAFEPYANLAYTHLKTNSFNETGTTAAALSVNSDTMDTTFTTLGLRASTAFTLGGVSSTARADLGWRHAYGDVTPLSTARFVGSDLFTVAGTALAKDVAAFEAGLDFDLTQAAKLGVTYNGQFGSGARQNGFNVKLGVSF